MEDGTGEAHLYVYDDMVATVLKLSSQQWRHLLDLAMRTGELCTSGTNGLAEAVARR